jgi:ribosome-binding protein aMBF1 (putative translation factor)
VTEAKKTNRGALRIKELNPGRGGAAAVAKKLDVDASVATRWFSGARRPDTKMRAALEREYGIGWMLWDDEVEEQEDGGAPTAAE